MFDPKYVELTRRLFRLMPGADNKDACALFDVSMTTWDKWKREHPELREAIRDGRTVSDAEVAHALYRSAVGAEVPAVKIFLVDKTIEERDDEGNVISTITTKEEMFVPYTERYPPNVDAAKFWLTNRRPADWKHRTEQKIDVQETVRFKLDVPRNDGLASDEAKVIEGEATEVEEEKEKEGGEE